MSSLIFFSFSVFSFLALAWEGVSETEDELLPLPEEPEEEDEPDPEEELPLPDEDDQEPEEDEDAERFLFLSAWADFFYPTFLAGIIGFFAIWGLEGDTAFFSSAGPPSFLIALGFAVDGIVLPALGATVGLALMELGRKSTMFCICLGFAGEDSTFA